MRYGIGFDEVLRLNLIKRWAIIDMARDQSVAEHSFSVALIVDKLARDLGFNFEDIYESVSFALWHDATEVYSGDIPTPAKPFFRQKEMEFKMAFGLSAKKRLLSDHITQLVKIADLLEALQYADRYCIDKRRDDIMLDILKNLRYAIESHRYGDKILEILIPIVEGINVHEP